MNADHLTAHDLGRIGRALDAAQDAASDRINVLPSDSPDREPLDADRSHLALIADKLLRHHAAELRRLEAQDDPPDALGEPQRVVFRRDGAEWLGGAEDSPERFPASHDGYFLAWLVHRYGEVPIDLIDGRPVRAIRQALRRAADNLRDAGLLQIAAAVRAVQVSENTTARTITGRLKSALPFAVLTE